MHSLSNNGTREELKGIAYSKMLNLQHLFKREYASNFGSRSQLFRRSIFLVHITRWYAQETNLNRHYLDSCNQDLLFVRCSGLVWNLKVRFFVVFTTGDGFLVSFVLGEYVTWTVCMPSWELLKPIWTRVNDVEFNEQKTSGDNNFIN